MKKSLMLLLSACLLMFAIAPAVMAEETTEEAQQAQEEQAAIAFQVLKEDADEASATSRYMQSPGQLVQEDDKNFVIVTLNNGAWWKSFKVQAAQPGTFEDDNFVEAEVLETDEEADTKVVKFEVQDLTQPLNAKIHIVATGVPGVGEYDNTYNIRLAFEEAETTPEAPGEEGTEETPEEVTLADGQYMIDFKALHEKEDKDSSMTRYIEKPAFLIVDEGKNVVFFTLLDNKQITAFQVEQDGEYVDANVVEVDETSNTRVVGFIVDDLTQIVNAKVEVSVPAQNYVGNHIVRLVFDPANAALVEELELVTFEDIQDSWAKNYIEALATIGVIEGVSDEHFAPEDNVTRAQFAILVAKALDLPLEKYEGTFADVPESLDWAVLQIEAANRAGIVEGHESGFAPHDNITREEMVTMLMRAVKLADESLLEDLTGAAAFADAAAIQSYAKEFVDQAVALGLVDGMIEDGNNVFKPADNATRAQAAKVIFELLALL